MKIEREEQVDIQEAATIATIVQLFNELSSQFSQTEHVRINTDEQALALLTKFEQQFIAKLRQINLQPEVYSYFNDPVWSARFRTQASVISTVGQKGEKQFSVFPIATSNRVNIFWSENKHWLFG